MNAFNIASTFQLGLVALSSLFFLVDPIATIPVFLFMTSDSDRSERARMARSAALTCFFVLAGFSLAGTLLFRLLGITLPAFQTAGGVILLHVGLDMVQARRSGTKEVPGEAEEALEKCEKREKNDAGIVPLGMPMLAGPGAISNVVVLTGQATHWWESLTVYVAIALTAFSCYFFLAGADRVRKRVSETGIHILTRIMGMLITALAVQFIATGAKGLGLLPLTALK
jgi:multiple antibiotic resistance protein